MKLKRKFAVAVDCCQNCPFRSFLKIETSSEYIQSHYCSAKVERKNLKHTTEGEKIQSTALDMVSAFICNTETIPDWCPLPIDREE